MDSHMKLFKQHNFQDQGCMICEEQGGFNMTEREEGLEIDDFVCICNQNFSWGHIARM